MSPFQLNSTAKPCGSRLLSCGEEGSATGGQVREQSGCKRAALRENHVI